MINVERLPRTTTPLIDIPFIFDSYRELTGRLGAVDGHAATLAIAARYFTDQSHLQADDQELGLELAAKYQVATRFIDLHNLPAHLHQLLIVGTTKYWEDFLIRFRREQLSLGRAWRERREGEDQLSYVLDCIDGGKTTNIKRVGEERCALVNYYRLVRNAAAHEFEKRARLAQEFDKVRQYSSLVVQEYRLQAPNTFSELTFEDHMLYTRVIKYLATDLCRLVPPRSFFEVRKVVADRSTFAPEPTFIRRFKGNDKKLTRGFSSFFKQHYNFTIDQDVMAQIVLWINELPNRKVRRRTGQGLFVQHLSDLPHPT